MPSIPEHWKTQRLKTVVSEKNVKGFPNEPLLAATQSHGVILKVNYGTRTVEAQKSLETLKLVDVDDFVISLRSFQGGIERAHARGIISPAYTILQARHLAHRDYLTLLFKSRQFIEALKLTVTGIREGQNIEYPRLSRDLVALPPADEQAAIVKYLGHAHARIDRAIATKRKLIALLEEQKQAIIDQAVTRGLDPSVPLKDSGIPWLGEIPAHWQTMPLSRCFESMVYGTSENARGDGPVTVIGMGDIRAGEVRVSGRGGLDAVPIGLELEPGDLLFNRTNSPNLVGKVGLYRNGRSDRVSFASYLVRLRPLPVYSSDWLVALLNSPNFLRFAQGQALVSLHQANLNPTRYGRLRIPVPPAIERATIGVALEGAVLAASTTSSTISRQIRLLMEFRTRLTSDVVTGQVDVREIAATLPELTDDAIALADKEFDDDDELAEAELEFAGADE